MNCLSCSGKSCKSEAKDCFDIKDGSLEAYKNPDLYKIYHDADYLVTSGRGGRLNRFEEIILFCKRSGYKKVSLAYCHSMENLALTTREILKNNGFKVLSVRCTAGGIRECEIGISNKASVNCNPVGQADLINRSETDFVIEMGLCLGHDVIFHKYLQKPFTVFIVKDRVYHHAPAKALSQEGV